jgi:hypothetical protein
VIDSGGSDNGTEFDSDAGVASRVGSERALNNSNLRSSGTVSKRGGSVFQRIPMNPLAVGSNLTRYRPVCVHRTVDSSIEVGPIEEPVGYGIWRMNSPRDRLECIQERGGDDAETGRVRAA